jgi:hypothetical protein
VRAQLRLDVAENQLKTATGATHGIRGIVRVKYVQATTPGLDNQRRQFNAPRQRAGSLPR